MAKCKLIDGANTVNVVEINRGEIVQIVDWTERHYIGEVAQRCNRFLFVLGSKSTYWNSIPWGRDPAGPWAKCRVRILGREEVVELRNEGGE